MEEKKYKENIKDENIKNIDENKKRFGNDDSDDETKSIVALVLVIIGFFFSIIGFILTIIGVVMAHIERKKKKSGITLATLIIGYISISLNLLIIIMLLLVLGLVSFQEDFNRQQSNEFNQVENSSIDNSQLKSYLVDLNLNSIEKSLTVEKI